MGLLKPKKIEVVSSLPETFNASPDNVETSDELLAPAATDEEHLGTAYSRKKASGFVAVAGVTLIAISYGGIKLNEFLENSMYPSLALASKYARVENGGLHIVYDVKGRLVEKAGALLLASQGESELLRVEVKELGPHESYLSDIGEGDVHITFTYESNQKTILLWDEIIKEAAFYA